MNGGAWYPVASVPDRVPEGSKSQAGSRRRGLGRERGRQGKAKGLCLGYALGVKGVGESGTVPGHAVVAGAIEDALRPGGVRIVKMPFETLIRLAQELDPESAQLYRTQILPDEYRHAAIGRQALLLLADTPERQRQAREACREMNERVFAAYRSHRARVDRSA